MMLATFFACCLFIMITSVYWISVIFYTSMNPCLMQPMLLEPLVEVLGSLQNPFGSCSSQTDESNGDILGTQ